MINPRELRIGNLIKTSLPEGKIIIKEHISANSDLKLSRDIISVYSGTIERAEYEPENYSPIPITEEWLLKFGFQNATTGGLYKDYGNISISLFNHTDYFSLGYIGTKIEYVHQLQNLYFALTGEELELK